MKKINLTNDHLLKTKFLFKNKNSHEDIINLFGALSDQSLYFRKKAKLNGSACLVGVNKIIEKSLESIDLKSLLKKHNYYLNLKTKTSNLNKRIKNWIKKDRIPIEFVRVLSITLYKDLEKQKEFIIKVLLNLIYVTDRTGSTKFRPPLLLKDIIEPHRIYDVGVSMGDGGLYKRAQQISDGALHGKDLNLTQDYIQNLKELKKNLWGLSEKSISIRLGKKENKNMYRLTIQNKFYVKYLNFVYDLPIGDKIKQNIKEPKILEHINKKYGIFIICFLYRGLIDTDGSYKEDASNINFWSQSPILINQFKKFLINLNIKFTSNKYSITICSDSYRVFLEKIGSSHHRKLRTILKRIRIPPKSYVLKGLRKEMVDKSFFRFENTNFHIKNGGDIFKEFRNRLGWTQTKYAKEFKIDKVTIRHWEYNINATPFKEIYRIIRLNKLDPYSELAKRVQYLEVGNINLPLKFSKKIFKVLKFIIPQKSFNHACVIKREGTQIKNKRFKKLLKDIENMFCCKIIKNKSTGAYYIYSTYLTSFLNKFFLYEKSWSPMNDNEINIFYRNSTTFLEGTMENLLPFEKEKKQLLIKKEVETDWNYGKDPNNISVGELITYGMVNINKPEGPR